ncbi:M14 family zinc carboxypeptidase [Tahibacter harae]|uniref:Choice-of-anchor J domain-containing protein n=1 Tax=Tahibacter harae TaxID=2963937 RepID=A0ABT1QT08_9GAMM|nr:M14 family zinc carboxypeptidase [Tahibacter harae]MCQ4165402.1 choice-of-anchor J domain-containing protein [Tahibacter harae]
MKRSYLIASLLLALGLQQAAAADASPQVVVVQTREQALIQQLGDRFGHVHVDRRKGVAMFEAGSADLEWLRAQRVEFQVDKNASAALQAQTEGRSLRSIPGFACYRTVEETQASVDALIAAHPQLASKIDIGDSWEKVTAGGNPGYDLVVLKLTNSAIPGPKPKLFAMTAIHAREYTTAELNTRFAEWLVNGYGSDPEATWLLDHNEFHLLLQSNPDGRKKAETGLSWRKNTNTAYCGSTSNSRGADLNRNFPFHWGGPGASNSQCDDTYRGPAAASEPETQAVVNYVESIYPDLRPDDTTTPAPDTTQGVFLDIHSFSQLVLWPWGDTTTLAPNSAALEMLGRRIGWFNNYDPQQSVGLYATSGTTDDTAYGRLGVPAYTIELGVAFFENCASFESSTYPRNVDALRYTARSLAAPYKLPSGPDALEITASPQLVVAGTPVRIEARIDDSRLNRTAQPQAGAPPPPTTQNVASARAYVDSLPWESGAAFQAMSAIDGSFNSGSEAVGLDLDTSGLASGKHLVYVQGTDSAGSAGPPNAVFIEVAQANEIATVHGIVRDAQTNAPLAASVKIGDATVQASAAGAYSRSLRAGTVDFEVSAPGHMTERVSGVNLSGGSDSTRDFLLAPNCSVFADDVEGANPGWTAQSPWGTSTTVSGNTSKVWTDSPAGNYGNSVNTSLTSPLLNLSGYADAVLSFDQRCVTEAGYDYGIVEISTNAAAGSPSWTELARCDGNNTTWTNQRITLPAAANGSATVKLRFRLTSDTSEVREGWSIDNIKVEAGGDACRNAADRIFDDGFQG